MSADQPATAAGAPSFATAAEDEVIVVEVGPEHKQFRIYATFLAYHSEYFRNALRGPWKEASERVITIDDIEPATFKLFIHWLYTQEIPEIIARTKWTSILGHDTFVESGARQELFLVLVKAYVFADRFLAAQFRSDINDAFEECLEEFALCGTVRCQVIKYAFTNIPPGRHILQQIIDDHCTSWDPFYETEEDVAAQDYLPHTFMLRAMRRQAELQHGGPNGDLRCYREHNSDEDKNDCDLLHMTYDEKRHQARFSTAVGGSFVTVKVGSESKIYHIHKPLLIHHPGYFRNALRGSWKEAQEGVVTLADVDSGIFNVFVEWLYKGDVPTTAWAWLTVAQHPNPSASEPNIEFDFLLTILKAYVLGDRLLSPHFRSASWSRFLRHAFWIRPGHDDLGASNFYRLVLYAYQSIPCQSVVLQWLADALCLHWSHADDKPEHLVAQKNLPSTFLLRVMRRYSEVRLEGIETKKRIEAEAHAAAAVAERASLPRADEPVPKKRKGNESRYNRCYVEHSTKEEEQRCVSENMSRRIGRDRDIMNIHMRYDENADYGFFK
ncbi:hypothetical protein FB567DRAFT_574567 [Paraphoma chrysanthemicola]|uniref:BTB domain-containing protein n=1 Tax=Paraphoma chrysanthemicola TaxID=798071 RepID=A0A8K0RIW6_9PLEO|nr:hypothetical protein FB567DRAFT_574567 [Paraphoma chrysanthemicola]